ncbi:MAG: hypothetical protein GY953_43070, partial [bacterium]|nr:hypothetical protein [bacterium]
MKRHTRRQFTTALGAAGLAGLPAVSAAAEEPGAMAPETYIESLNGAWQFRLDTERDWTTVQVPHTWQVDNNKSEYTGVAWYRREFDAPAAWRGQAVRIEFEAVYHSAWVTVNGQPVGSHERKGYTAFSFDISKVLRLGERNRLEVKVDNTFRDDMLPRNTSYDWVKDGGITRPVQLLVTPAVFIERVEVNADPNLDTGDAAIDVRAVVRNSSAAETTVRLSGDVRDEDSGLHALHIDESAKITLPPNSQKTIALPAAT